MATHIFHGIRDENEDARYGANVAKTKKKAGLGGLKPLSDITNSEKPSGVKAFNKNVSVKGHDNVMPYLQNFKMGFEGSVARQSNASDTQKKGDRSGRRALADISNSKKLSQIKIPDTQKKAGHSGRKAITDISNSKGLYQHQAIEKAFPEKLDDIAEEGFLHNHQGCIDTMTRGLEWQSYFSTFGFDDDFSEGMGTPSSHLKSEPKADFASSPRYIEYEDVPDLLNEARHQHLKGTFENLFPPSPRHCLSPKFERLASP